MKVFITQFSGPLADWEHDFLPQVRKWFSLQTQCPFELTDSPVEAELIPSVVARLEGEARGRLTPVREAFSA